MSPSASTGMIRSVTWGEYGEKDPDEETSSPIYIDPARAEHFREKKGVYSCTMQRDRIGSQTVRTSVTVECREAEKLSDVHVDSIVSGFSRLNDLIRIKIPTFNKPGDIVGIVRGFEKGNNTILRHVSTCGILVVDIIQDVEQSCRGKTEDQCK